MDECEGGGLRDVGSGGERKGKEEDFVGWWVGGLRCS